MTPLSFEWKWTADYLIFMGLLYLALAVVVCGLLFVWVRTWLDLDAEENGERSFWRSRKSGLKSPQR